MQKVYVKKIDVGFFITLMIALAFAFALSSCAQQPRVSSMSDQIGVVYATVEGVANSVALHVEAGILDPGSAQRYHDQLAEVKRIADTASVAILNDKPQSALEALQLANKVLFEVQIQLQKQVEGSQ